MVFEVKNGSFGYPRSQNILKHITFSMDQPEVLSVLGANGAGKTTLLKCMLGLLPWREGGTYLDGRDIKDIPYHQFWQKVGYVPQAKASVFSCNTEDMVLLGRNAYLGTFGQPGKRDREIAEECMEEIGIAHLKGRACSQISGGELQMVLIARALAARPSVLVLDEPESNLDFRNQLIVLRAIERLCREKGIYAVVNTHYPEHALSISQKALLLTEEGEAVFGAADEVLSEANLDRAFGVEVKLYPLQLKNRTFTCVLPVGLKEA